MAVTADGRLRQAAGDAALEISPSDGGRLSSLMIGGREILKTEGYGPIAWGCYAMAPFAGRIRDGRFTFRGRSVELPLNRPPHAIHGEAFERPWQVVDDGTLRIDIGDPWPFKGSLVQRVELTADTLRTTLELHADEAMPVSVGWHPWFRRRLAPDESPVVLEFRPEWMFVRDEQGLPSGELVPPSAGPWDDCFSGVWSDPTLRWPGLELTIGSSAAFWVVYDEEDDALCVEPQTAPPDAPNLDPQVVEADSSLVATMEWRWRTT